MTGMSPSKISAFQYIYTDVKISYHWMTGASLRKILALQYFLL